MRRFCAAPFFRTKIDFLLLFYVFYKKEKNKKQIMGCSGSKLTIEGTETFPVLVEKVLSKEESYVNYLLRNYKRFDNKYFQCDDLSTENYIKNLYDLKEFYESIKAFYEKQEEFKKYEEEIRSIYSLIKELTERVNIISQNKKLNELIKKRPYIRQKFNYYFVIGFNTEKLMKSYINCSDNIFKEIDEGEIFFTEYENEVEKYLNEYGDFGINTKIQTAMNSLNYISEDLDNENLIPIDENEMLKIINSN